MSKSKKEIAEVTARVLMSLVMDVNQLVETVERSKVQVFTLAREYGIDIPAA
jgi:hypothetical protein